MTSPSCQQDSRTTAEPALVADHGLPSVPVVRKHALRLGFVAARVRLVRLITEGSLVAASIEAYAAALPHLAHRVPARDLSESALIAVRVTEPADGTGVVVLPVRWHATGTSGQPVRVLSADLMLIAARADRTVLRLHGAFRLPFVLPGPEPGHGRVAHRVAAASVNAFVQHVRQQLAVPAGGTTES